jgi:hypothetical protein
MTLIQFFGSGGSASYTPPTIETVNPATATLVTLSGTPSCTINSIKRHTWLNDDFVNVNYELSYTYSGGGAMELLLPLPHAPLHPRTYLTAPYDTAGSWSTVYETYINANYRTLTTTILPSDGNIVRCQVPNTTVTSRAWSIFFGYMRS